MRHRLITVLVVLRAVLISAQTDISGTWNHTQTNKVNSGPFSNETYVLVTTYQLTTNGHVDITTHTLPQPPSISYRMVLNTHYAGTYAVDGNRLTVKAPEVSGFIIPQRPFPAEWLIAATGRTLILTNAITGIVTPLKKEDPLPAR